MKTNIRWHRTIIILIAVLSALLFAAWILAGYLPTRNIATPACTVIERKAEYEVRAYDGYIVAETVKAGNHDHSLNMGFGELFQYITGNNSRKYNMPTTAPVLHSNGTERQTIPMTAPVMNQMTGGQYTVAFVMPAGATLSNLPEPRSSSVKLREVRAHKAAVITFSGNPTEKIMKEKTAALLSYLQRDGKRTRSEPQEAFYNPPWTPPFMRRNEIMVEIE